jgi:hypothetical protein
VPLLARRRIVKESVPLQWHTSALLHLLRRCAGARRPQGRLSPGNRTGEGSRVDTADVAHPVVITPRLQAAVERIRPIALGLPGATERISHGSPTFFTADGRRGKTFASVHNERDWGEGRLCLWAASREELRAALIEEKPERFFIPPYVGHRGWLGLRLDLDPVDWDEVAGVIEDAYIQVTSKTAP